MPNAYFTTNPPHRRGQQHRTYYFFNNANPLNGPIFITTPSMYYTNSGLKSRSRSTTQPVLRQRLIAMSGGGSKGEARARLMLRNAYAARTGPRSIHDTGHEGQIRYYTKWKNAIGEGSTTRFNSNERLQRRILRRIAGNASLAQIKQLIVNHLSNMSNPVISRNILNRLGISRNYGPSAAGPPPVQSRRPSAAGPPVQSRRRGGPSSARSSPRSARSSPSGRSAQNEIILSQLRKLTRNVTRRVLN